jgi:2-dehydropantoate 2-reductase
VEVWALDPAEDHVAAINRDGLKLTGAVTCTGAVSARTRAQEIPDCPLVIIATKGTVTEAACAQAAPLLAGATVCSVQNGIGNEEVIAGYAPRVIRGVTLPAGRLTAPGVIEIVGPGPTWLGPFEPRPAPEGDITRLAEMLNAGGLHTTACADARPPQWTKLLFNAAVNPLCALTGMTHGQLIADPPMRALASQIISEGKAVAAASMITLEDDPEPLIDHAGRANHGHRPSMLQDVAARRATEIDTLNGGIVREGEAHGVATPVNALMRTLIREIERGWPPA